MSVISFDEYKKALKKKVAVKKAEEHSEEISKILKLMDFLEASYNVSPIDEEALLDDYIAAMEIIQALANRYHGIEDKNIKTLDYIIDNSIDPEDL